MWAMISRSISSGFERLPIASHPEIRSRAKLRTSSQMLSNMQGQCQDLTKSMPLSRVQGPREKPLSWTLAKSPVQDLRQGPMCRTLAKGPCAGPKPGAHVQDPFLQARGPCARPMPCPCIQDPSCCCHAAAATPKQEQGTQPNFPTRGHVIPISMMNQDRPHAT